MANETISPKQCLDMIDQVFVEVCQEEGVLSDDALKQAKKVQQRYFKQGEHASMQDILMYEGLLTRRQVDRVIEGYGDQIFGCVVCNQISRYPDGKPERCSAPDCTAARDGSSVVRVFRSIQADITRSDRFKRGTVLDGFEIKDVLGSGAMGRVFRAADASGQLFAMKVLSPDDGITWEDVKRFQHEVKMLETLKHDYVVNIHSSGSIDNCHYYCMELIGGDTLQRKIERGIQPSEAIEIGRQVAAALSHIHKNGVVHRDLKPENIKFDDEGRARVLDFGVAKNQLQTTQMTEYGTALGTPAYMSPEQARGEIDKVGEPTDIYALGVLLYEMTTGKIPFHDELDVTRLLDRIETDDPTPPRGHDEEIPVDLERVIQRAMAKKPADRYASAEQMGEDLTALAAGEEPPHLNGRKTTDSIFTRLVRKIRGD